MIQSGIKIGSAANLLSGFKPVWNTSEVGSSPLFAPVQNPTTITEADVIIMKNALFDYPVITLHDNLQSLLSDLFEYVVLPFKGEERSFSIPAGPLILNSEYRNSTVQTLSNYMGIDFSKNYSYLLVKLRRLSGISEHDVLRTSKPNTFDRMAHLTEVGRLAMSRLRPGERLSMGLNHDAIISENHADKYLDFFYEFGTHFISKIYYGDYIFQIFAYNKENFSPIKKAFANDSTNGILTGLQTLNYNYYTGNRLVSEYGAIVIHSGDPELAKTIDDKAWYDKRYAHGNSIFAVFTNNALAQTLFLSQFDKIVPIGFELTPLNRFIEIFRSFSWQRVLKGALLQRYGKSIRLDISGFNKRDTAVTVNSPMDELLTKAAASCGEVLVCEDTMDMSRLKFENKVKSIVAMSNVMQFPDNAFINLPGCSINLISHYIYSADKSWNMPEIVVDDEAFPTLLLHFEKMHGVIKISNFSGSKSSIVLDGFCYIDNGTQVSLKKLKLKLSKEILKKASDGIRQLTAERMLFQTVKKKNSFDAHNVDYFTDKIINYNQMTRLFVSDLNRNLKQKSGNIKEVAVMDVGSLLFDYFYDLYMLRTEIAESFIKSSGQILYADSSIIEDINRIQLENAKSFKNHISDGTRYNSDFSYLAAGIRFQQKQIRYIFEKVGEK